MDKKILILIIGIAVIGLVAIFGLIYIFMVMEIGLWQVPFLGTRGPLKMLVIGEPSIHLMSDLDSQRDLVYYQIKEPAGLEFAPKEQLANYDVILLDQHLGATPYQKSVSRTLGEAIENYVKTGGKLIVVMDSGIYRSGGMYGTGVASDVIGWKETFGDIIPVECDIGSNN
ncbi:MAG: hypothetical protein Q8N60_04820, partial [Candidatus Diapherotrites archaeon]|nr:hypothetical protein [Candidatus Diapherotrites archaeon]